MIIDELGRATSTEDGIGIAWAVSEYLIALGVCCNYSVSRRGVKLSHHLAEMPSMSPVQLGDFTACWFGSAVMKPPFVNSLAPAPRPQSLNTKPARTLISNQNLVNVHSPALHLGPAPCCRPQHPVPSRLRCVRLLHSVCDALRAAG